MKSTKFYFTKRGFVLVLTFAMAASVMAQSGNGTGGIDAATNAIKAYANPVGSLILAIGGIVGLIGGVRIYIKWNSGDRDVNKALMGWFGSCLFLVLVGTVIKGFFG